MEENKIKVIPANNSEEAVKMADAMLKPYGWCPTCGAPGVSRERSVDGDTICLNGHKTKSTEMLDQ